MRHRVQAKHFNRHANARKGLFKGLVRELVEHGSITTTKQKAKAIKGIADKIVSTAQAGDLAARHLLHRFFGARDVVNTLVDRVAPAMSSRVSGFTTMSDIGIRRGDSAELVKLSWTQQPDQVGSLKKPAAASTTAAKASQAKTAGKAPSAAKPSAAKVTEKAPEGASPVVAKTSKVSATTTKQAASKPVTKVSAPQQRTTNK
jgi:large subunit ribosomal protein L17